MNRRFRVWDPIEEEMHLPPHDYVILSDGQVRWKVTRSNDRTGSYTVLQPTRHDVTPMHYTGLADAEGAPVYEGDLMKMANVEGVFEVIWSTRNARWEIVTPGVDHGFPLGAHNHSHIVAGNKFQTAELLD